MNRTVAGLHGGVSTGQCPADPVGARPSPENQGQRRDKDPAVSQARREFWRHTRFDFSNGGNFDAH